jgi:hypothetical protein
VVREVDTHHLLHAHTHTQVSTGTAHDTRHHRTRHTARHTDPLGHDDVVAVLEHDLLVAAAELLGERHRELVHLEPALGLTLLIGAV